MAIAITDQASTIKFDLGNGEEHHIDKTDISVKKKFGSVYVYGNSEETTGFTKLRMRWTDVSSPVVVSNTDLINTPLGYKVSVGVTVGDVRITDGVETVEVNVDGSINTQIVGVNGNDLKIEDNGSMPVTIQDQDSPIVAVKMSRLTAGTTLAAPITLNDTTITVTSNTAMAVGSQLAIFDPTAVRYAIVKILAVNGTSIDVDTPLDFAFPNGSFVDVSETNMAVNGSLGTPIVFGVRNNAGAVPPPGLELSLDIVRVIFQCITDSAVDYDLFGNIAALTNGIVLRNRDGETHNIFNVKTTGELAGLMYDLSVHDVKQGTNGFIARLTFGGQNKMGSVIRLDIDEDLELWVQDNLTGLTTLEIMAEGSIVLP